MILFNYNPFELLSTRLLYQIIKEGAIFIVLQRFSWPGISAGKSFMATIYDDDISAMQHEAELSDKEGKVLSLQKDLDKLKELIEGQEYRIFINTFKDKDWSSKLIKAYKSNIAGYVRSKTKIKASDGLDIELKIKWGRVIALLRSGDIQLEVPIYELIK